MKKTLKSPKSNYDVEAMEIFHRTIVMVRTSETQSHLFVSRRYFENYRRAYKELPYQESVFEYEYDLKRIKIFKETFKNESENKEDETNCNNKRKRLEFKPIWEELKRFL